MRNIYQNGAGQPKDGADDPSGPDLNSVLDRLLETARADISGRGMQRVTLPDISEKLKQRVGPIKISGTFVAFHGWAESLASLHRTGDAAMSAQGDKVVLDVPLGLTDLHIG